MYITLGLNQFLKSQIFNVLVTVKLEMFVDINVCEFLILKIFALLKFAILGLPKVNFVFPQNNVPLLILLTGYIRWIVLFIHICSRQVITG